MNSGDMNNGDMNSGDMNSGDDLTGRLHDLGSRPVDPQVASRHLTALSGVSVRPSWTTRLKVASALVAGLVLGGTGLASANVLPDGAQEVAHQTLGKVGIKVAPGHERYNDPTECPGGPYRNHGQYVKAHPNDPNASKSRCGKPVKSGQTPEANEPNDDTGPPAWAPAHGKRGDKGAAKQQEKQAKPDQPDQPEPGEQPEQDENGPNDPSPGVTTESTLAPTTTSSAPPPTTTTSTP